MPAPFGKEAAPLQTGHPQPFGGEARPYSRPMPAPFGKEVRPMGAKQVASSNEEFGQSGMTLSQVMVCASCACTQQHLLRRCVNWCLTCKRGCVLPVQLIVWCDAASCNQAFGREDHRPQELSDQSASGCKRKACTTTCLCWEKLSFDGILYNKKRQQISVTSARSSTNLKCGLPKRLARSRPRGGDLRGVQGAEECSVAVGEM